MPVNEAKKATGELNSHLVIIWNKIAWIWHKVDANVWMNKKIWFYETAALGSGAVAYWLEKCENT